MEIGGVWDMSYGYLFFRPAWFEPQIASRRLVIERGTVSGRAALLWRCTEVNHYFIKFFVFCIFKDFWKYKLQFKKVFKKEGKERKKKEKEKKGENIRVELKLLFIFSPFFYLPKNGGKKWRAMKERAKITPWRTKWGRAWMSPLRGRGDFSPFMFAPPRQGGGQLTPRQGGNFWKLRGKIESK